MADSVDRVFGHALNTVNKIRTGSQKPPVADRLKLYGLYKQSMEGDVSYIQDRPAGSTEQAKKEQEKWDAWHANSGLPRTVAKKQYIETLITTMHTYASTTPEARELVGELEFVWDQIKNNSNASSSSQGSPLQLHDSGQQYPGLATSSIGAFDSARGRDLADEGKSKGKGKMRVLSPVSQAQEEEEEEDGRDEFVDAPVSQFGEQGLDSPMEEKASPAFTGAVDERPADLQSMKPAVGDLKWRRRIEAALFKMTTEVAALREQLESRRQISARRRSSLLGSFLRLGWFFVKMFVVDVLVLWIVILYLRRKKDRRLEGAVRVLLGDAVAQMQKVGRDMQKVNLPNLPKLPTRRT